MQRGAEKVEVRIFKWLGEQRCCAVQRVPAQIALDGGEGLSAELSVDRLDEARRADIEGRRRAHADPKKRSAPARVEFDSDACETATLVEIIAEDRPGLLYNLATVFSSTACNIDVVLIDTKGHRAIDVFYVAHEGQKLSPELQATLRDKLLAVC